MILIEFSAKASNADKGIEIAAVKLLQQTHRIPIYYTPRSKSLQLITLHSYIHTYVYNTIIQVNSFTH